MTIGNKTRTAKKIDGLRIMSGPGLKSFVEFFTMAKANDRQIAYKQG